MSEHDYSTVVDANIELHTSIAANYRTVEPHFRPENVARVDAKIRGLATEVAARRLLDLGCGTGFIIDIGKKYVPQIHGVDVTQAMLDRVDTSGPAEIVLHLEDSGRFPAAPGSFDIVTSYSFLHHLFDIVPTLRTAATALRPGGKYYVDLEPNQAFWQEVQHLTPNSKYDPIVERERSALNPTDADVHKQLGVSLEIFNRAEHGKSVKLGFATDTLTSQLKQAGFTSVEFFYSWFVGQGLMINDPQLEVSERFAKAATVNELLQRALPLSRHLFKYVGFVATR